MNKYSTLSFALKLIGITALLVYTLSIPSKADDSNAEYLEIEWIQLMPKDDLNALLNPPEVLLDIEDGASNDNLDSLDKLSETDENAKRFKQALTSTRVIESYHNKRIRIPGFMVPLESNEDQLITEFFIVPYFGACLHLPPPPPNQIIHGRFEQGVELNSLQDPFWFDGTIIIELTENDLGQSAYTMQLDKVILFGDE
ncbi:DUF3299 domain-containing protein [Glaciecola sp. KUL10]|uniref:DUF3299 domain-containing protein n=1 Tax=Glaciecola sp. (strain KUL10) TaxID=2161813 RepID=UPI001F264E3F|nr:DUF3299 domain-containing protein [Glaciecola sp. KUL10]